MKRHYFGLMGLLAILLFAACKKKDKEVPHDPVKQAAIDEQLIQQYIADSSLTEVVKDASGLHYKILSRGTTPNDTITLEDRMNITYSGKLLDGSEFDSGANTTLDDARLKNLIEGWKIGLRKIAKGDEVLLLIPSGLAYKTASYPGIPANSVLVFEITLNNFYY